MIPDAGRLDKPDKKAVHEAIDQLYQARMNAAELLEEAENGLRRIPH